MVRSSTVVRSGKEAVWARWSRNSSAREAAARAEADRLRARIGELSGDLARAEERVLRLAITREEVARVLEEPPEADTARQEGTPAGKPGPASPIGAVTVPPWQEGAEASVLPRAYQDLLEVAEDAGRPLRAAEFAVAAGLATDKAKVEALRSKLKRLAARGWLAGEPGGLFTLHDHEGKHRNPDSKGFFFLGSEVLANPDLKKEEPPWQRMPRFRPMIRSPSRKPCSPRWPTSSPALPQVRSRPASWRSSSTRRAGRLSCSCCRTTTTCGPSGKNSRPGSILPRWRAPMGSPGPGWRPGTAGCCSAR